MYAYLTLTFLILALQIFYGTSLPPSFPQSAFLIGLLRIPLFVVLALIHPPHAVLVRTTADKADRRPRGLDTADAIISAVFVFAMSRNMGLVAGIGESSLRHFEIFLPLPEGDFSLRSAIVMSIVTIIALNLGKWTSLWFVPVFEWIGLLRWDEATMEVSEDAERGVDRWQLGPEWTGFW